MRARTLLLLIVALVLAGGTTMMARVWLASQRSAPAEASPISLPTPAKSVLIARAQIQRGQLLKPEDFSWEPWPEGGIDKNYVVIGTKTPDAFAGWVARNPISAGEPITDAKIIAPGNRGYLSAVLRPGKRAVSVPVSTTTGISGFVFPGDQVDLIVTYSVQEVARPGQTQQGPTLDHKVSETVLRDIRVIAIDQKLDAAKAGEANANLKTATLELTPKETEIVALASEMGKMSLSLRSLVPGPGELRQEISDLPTTDAPIPQSETYTVDSDISPLLHNPLKPKGNADTDVVTILRGGANSSASNTTVTPKTGG
jgi:pilus assembly protein CpaB